MKDRLRDFAPWSRPLLGLVAALLLTSLFLPVGDTLWAKVLTISGRVRTRAFEGCSPGFWKQEKHFPSWPEGFEPEAPFIDVFGESIDPDLTLLEALELGGGQEKALSRHAVAALLNAAHPDVDFPMSTNEVIQRFQVAFGSGDPELIEGTTAEFEGLNEAGCRLPLATPTPTPSASPTETATPTETMTPTPTGTPTATPIATDTATPTDTSTPTDTPTATFTPTPPLQGCSVGFWKQEKHFDEWPTPYTTETLFKDVFGRQLAGDPTLLGALELKGGELNKLARQATAGLLNAAHDGVNYAFMPEEVIAKFQNAFDSGDYDPTAAEFEAANDSACPLGK